MKIVTGVMKKTVQILSLVLLFWYTIIIIPGHAHETSISSCTTISSVSCEDHSTVPCQICLSASARVYIPLLIHLERPDPFGSNEIEPDFFNSKANTLEISFGRAPPSFLL